MQISDMGPVIINQSTLTDIGPVNINYNLSLCDNLHYCQVVFSTIYLEQINWVRFYTASNVKDIRPVTMN